MVLMVWFVVAVEMFVCWFNCILIWCLWLVLSCVGLGVGVGFLCGCCVLLGLVWWCLLVLVVYGCLCLFYYLLA